MYDHHLAPSAVKLEETKYFKCTILIDGKKLSSMILLDLRYFRLHVSSSLFLHLFSHSIIGSNEFTEYKSKKRSSPE